MEIFLEIDKEQVKGRSKLRTLIQNIVVVNTGEFRVETALLFVREALMCSSMPSRIILAIYLQRLGARIGALES